MMNPILKSPSEIPRAKLKRRTILSAIWMVPLVAAIIGGVLVFQFFKQMGPTITIQFENGNDLDANQTVIRYRGVRIGSVRSVRLTPDTRHVEVRVQLDRSAASLARTGTVFWIVRPQVGAAGVHALETIVSGPYIEALPGEDNGPSQNTFIGADEEPIITRRATGVEFILCTSQIRSLAADSPVYYRGLQIGSVQYLELGQESTMVRIHVLIKTEFAPLIRINSVWWNAGGVNVDWHLFSGINMTAENLQSVLTGGIALATPEKAAEAAQKGMVFTLHDEVDAKWLKWSPTIALTNATARLPATSSPFELNNVHPSSEQ